MPSRPLPLHRRGAGYIDPGRPALPQSERFGGGDEQLAVEQVDSGPVLMSMTGGLKPEDSPHPVPRFCGAPGGQPIRSVIERTCFSSGAPDRSPCPFQQPADRLDGGPFEDGDLLVGPSPELT